MQHSLDIKLTETASSRINKYLKSNTDREAIRFGVKKTGCSGYSFFIDYANKKSDEDIEVTIEDIKFYIDGQSSGVVNNTTIDFVKSGFQEAFRFSNPKIVSECGCGESFTVEE